MRHRVKTKKLNRTASHRKSLYFSLMKSLIENDSIVTTKEKAKAVRPKMEKLVTKARENNLSTRRYLLSRLKNNTNLVDKLLNDIAGKYRKRNGGYLRIRRLHRRKGDNTQMVSLSWVEEDKKKPTKKKKAGSKSKKSKKAKDKKKKKDN